jgi:CheY-like chemotaxis protein
MMVDEAAVLVLLVDPNEDRNTITVELLRGLGCSVISTENWLDGFRQFEASPAAIDAVFVALDLEERNGRHGGDFAAWVKSQRPVVKTVLICDAEVAPPRDQRDVDEFLEWPFGAADVRQVLEHLGLLM